MRNLILSAIAVLALTSCAKDDLTEITPQWEFFSVENSITSKSTTRLNINIAGNNWGDFDVTNVVPTDYGSIITLVNGKKTWSLTVNNVTSRAILIVSRDLTLEGDITASDRTSGFTFVTDNHGTLDTQTVVITIL